MSFHILYELVAHLKDRTCELIEKVLKPLKRKRANTTQMFEVEDSNYLPTIGGFDTIEHDHLYLVKGLN